MTETLPASVVWYQGAESMKERMVKELTAWAVTCPNAALADDLWDFVLKAREVKVEYTGG